MCTVCNIMDGAGPCMAGAGVDTVDNLVSNCSKKFSTIFIVQFPIQSI